MIALIHNLLVTVKKLGQLSKITTDDLKRAFQEEKEVWDLYYPYIAERQSAMMALLLGAWLIATHKATFAGPHYHYMRSLVSQPAMAWGLFFTGLVHAISLYAYNHPHYSNSDVPIFGRRIALFTETIWWAFFAVLLFMGFPPGLGFALFGSLGLGSYRAFQDTGNKKKEVKSRFKFFGKQEGTTHAKRNT